jgi:hypothetical protein
MESGCLVVGRFATPDHGEIGLVRLHHGSLDK